MNLGILASGNLGFKTCTSLLERGLRPIFLFSDKNSVELRNLSIEQDIPILTGNPRNGRGLSFVKSLSCDVHLILSVNYLFLLEQDIINYPKFGCVNIHGSLLPKYRGRTPHVWAIINNEKVTGITAHFIDSGCDTGPIILQEIVAIENYYTGANILHEFEKRYPDIILKTISLFIKDRPHVMIQDENKATYFGKRNSEDGRINWGWQKERIYNWVRAQANPYPGAFSNYGQNKIVIDEIEFTDAGFRWDIENGTIMTGGHRPEVKTPNGVVKIVKNRSELIFEAGKILE